MNETDLPLKSDGGTRTVIDPPGGWFRIDFRELWQYRYLVALLVYRDFVIYYKQTILGPLWWLIHPLFTTGMFTVIFAMIADISTDDLPAPLFYLAGIIVWNYFYECLRHTARTFLDNSAVFGKIYFPRLIVPLSIILSNLLKFGLQFGLFLVFYAVYYVRGAPIAPSVYVVFLPLLILYVALFGLGAGLLVASVTTKYRDLVLAIPFLAQLWMFASAVICPLSQVPERWQFWFSLNPMVPPMELFRYLTLGAGTVTPASCLCGVATVLSTFLLGLGLFSRIEKTFADTI